MGKVFFTVNTKADNPEKLVSIRIRYKDGKIDQATATGEKVKLAYWHIPSKEEKSKRTDQGFKRTAFPGKDNMIARLKKLETHVLNEAEKTKDKKTGWLLDVVNRYKNPQQYKNASSLFEWLDVWIENLNVAKRTKYKYEAARNSLKEFNPKLDWQDIDLNFYDAYLKKLQKDELATNTIGDRIKVIKAFCNAARQRKIHSNLDFKDFYLPNEQSDSIYLNETELQKIYDLDLTEQPYLDRVRDIFLIGAWTGCRFSDLHKINNTNIQGNFIHIEQDKTKAKVVLPLHPIVKAILTKYDGNLPPMISNQKFNEYLKLVAEKAEIKGNINKGITRGGKRENTLYKKHKLVTSHTARRSFATNLYKSKFPTISIMQMTGHRTEAAFLKYIKVTPEEHAELLMEHWNNLNKVEAE